MPKSLATQEWKRMAWGRFPHFRSEEGKYEATSTLVLASETATLQMSIGSNPLESRPCVTAVLGLMCKLSPFLHFFSSTVLVQLSPHSTHSPLPHLLVTGHHWAFQGTCLWQRGSQPGVLSQGIFGHVRRQFHVGGWCQHLVCRTMEQHRNMNCPATELRFAALL